MKTFDFQGHTIVARNVVAVGPVEADAELGGPAFVVYTTGGELTFKELDGCNSREHFLYSMRNA